MSKTIHFKKSTPKVAKQKKVNHRATPAPVKSIETNTSNIVAAPQSEIDNVVERFAGLKIHQKISAFRNMKNLLSDHASKSIEEIGIEVKSLSEQKFNIEDFRNQVLSIK